MAAQGVNSDTDQEDQQLVIRCAAKKRRRRAPKVRGGMERPPVGGSTSWANDRTSSSNKDQAYREEGPAAAIKSWRAPSARAWARACAPPVVGTRRSRKNAGKEWNAGGNLGSGLNRPFEGSATVMRLRPLGRWFSRPFIFHKRIGPPHAARYRMAAAGILRRQW